LALLAVVRQSSSGRNSDWQRLLSTLPWQQERDLRVICPKLPDRQNRIKLLLQLLFEIVLMFSGLVVFWSILFLNFEPYVRRRNRE
jgi:hypothetical protein